MIVNWEGIDDRVTIALDINECASLFGWLREARTHYIDAEVRYENEAEHYQAGVMQAQSQGIMRPRTGQSSCGARSSRNGWP